jgi:hypothetical protein
VEELKGDVLDAVTYTEPMSAPVTPRTQEGDVFGPSFSPFFLRALEASPSLQAALSNVSPIKNPHPPRVCRSLSEGPSDEIQERVRRTLAQLPTSKQVGGRRVELLVHNVSHKDMILSLSSERAPSASAVAGGGGEDDLVLCRPKFSLFQPISKALDDALDSGQLESCKSATFPVYTREPKREPAQSSK